MIVYELHGLGDVAVDTARRFQARLGQRLDVDKAVNLLADPLSRAPGHRAAVPMVEAEQFNALAAQLADAQRQAAKAQSDRDDAEARAAMLAAQLDQMRRSRSWRMTAPLRNAKIALTQPFR